MEKRKRKGGEEGGEKMTLNQEGGQHNLSQSFLKGKYQTVFSICY